METIKRVVKGFLLGVSLLVFGCSSVVNPYSGDFTCPLAEQGKCVSIPTAYEESVKGKPLTLDEGKEVKKEGDSVIESEYRDALFQRLNKLLREPKTPLLAPPKIVRVMILPYRSGQGKEFYSARYVYVLVEDPQWILQNITSLPVDEQEQ